LGLDAQQCGKTIFALFVGAGLASDAGAAQQLTPRQSYRQQGWLPQQ
jgi:hypothetical protein